MNYSWNNIQVMLSKSYTCGYCNNPLASDKGYFGGHNATGKQVFIYICHQCGKPTFFDEIRNQTPGSAYGEKVSHVDDAGIDALYEEARKCFSTNSFTAVVLSCRKILMHIAVSRGAKEGETFIKYVEYLSDNNFIPPGAKGWVDYIREKGNEANHEIAIMSFEEAKRLLDFIQMLLKIIYEFPANIKEIPKVS